MSALGQKQTLDWRPLMSALPPKADIAGRQLDVRFVPITDRPKFVLLEIVVVNLAGGRRLHSPGASRSAVPCC
jgi:hypothetical protein